MKTAITYNMIRMLMAVLISINLFYLAFAQDIIEGRWHLVGYENNVMYQFVDTELFADAGLKYTLYSMDGDFDDLEGDNTGGTPHPYSVMGNVITIDYHFGNIVSYQMNYQCDGQVVEFYNSDYNMVSFILFREYYDYNDCQEAGTLECSEMNESECSFDDFCEWVEDLQTENCYGIAWNVQDCEEIEGCNWWTSSYYGTANCAGSYQIDNSYCDDLSIILGDIDGDDNVDVLDVIILVNHILSPAAVVLDGADINNDGEVNIIDVIELVSIILEN